MIRAGRAAGAATVLLPILALGTLALAARSRTGPLHRLDMGTARQLNQFVGGHPNQLRRWQAVSTVGSPTGWRVLAAAAALVLWLRRRRDEAALVALAMAGAPVLSGLVKALVGRSRPVVAVVVGRASGKSFPSGHALTSFVAVGLLVLLVWPTASARQRALLVAAAVLMVATIGFSRLALGVHYLTDVLSGWLIGALWLLGCRQLLHRRRAVRQHG